MRLVLDTDVMVAALQSPNGASRHLLLAVRGRRVETAVSVPLMLEWEAVLKRPTILRAAALAPADVDAVLDEIASVAVPVELWFHWRPATPDPGDDMVLETAINGGADVLVTFNLRHMAAPAARFGIIAERPAETVRRLR